MHGAFHSFFYSTFSIIFKFNGLIWTASGCIFSPFIIPGCYLLEGLKPSFREITPLLNLGIFAILVLYAIYILLTSYLRTKLAKIRLIAIAFIIPFFTISDVFRDT
ncbi:hypothetical protein OL548_20690 [Lysinibacillus sp. MHQ-1]|nr:hypothetical protein OL548_20690 [Lysinibacillus sp. MHQ-1]